MTFKISTRANLIAAVSMLLAAGCMAGEDTASNPDPGMDSNSSNDQGSDAGPSVNSAVSVTFLASDQPGLATNLAPSMINAWGITQFDGMFWIADNGTGKVSILDGKGVPATGKVASGAIDLGVGITGVVVTDVADDDASSFPIHTPDACGTARLIFASETGQLFGVNPDLSTTGGFVVVDRSNVDAIYMGVAIVQGASGPLILAADFHNARIDVFNTNFELVTDVSFGCAQVLPEGFAPFNVMTFDNTVYVTYAKQDADKEDDVPGPGLGFVVAFDASGTLLGIAKGPSLNAPWGMDLARDFRPFPNALLVGNFGDGHVTAIDTSTMMVLGQLTDDSGVPIAIDGLWGLSFGAAVTNARPGGLYFAAGPQDETHGLFGVIMPAATH